MQVKIEHIEKKQGLIFGKRLYGVRTTVTFSEEEKAIIGERKLHRAVIKERELPADKDEFKENNRSLVGKLAKAAIQGADSLNHHMTIGKLLAGPDEYFMTTPIECKAYDVELREDLKLIKEFIEGNKEIGGQSDTFEL